MNEKNRKKQRAQELVTNRVMAVFVFVVLLLWGMSWLSRLMTFGTTFLLGRRVNLILTLVSGALTVLFLVLLRSQLKKGTFRKDRVFNTALYALFSGAFCAGCLILRFCLENGAHIVYVFLPLCAVLYLVFYVYERQFFSFCVLEAVAISAAYCIYRSVLEGKALILLAGVLCVAAGIFALLAKKDGRLTHAILGRQYDKRYILLTCAVTLAALALAALLKGSAALIAGIVLGVYVLASAVYFTIKAM